MSFLFLRLDIPAIGVANALRIELSAKNYETVLARCKKWVEDVRHFDSKITVVLDQLREENLNDMIKKCRETFDVSPNFRRRRPSLARSDTKAPTSRQRLLAEPDSPPRVPAGSRSFTLGVLPADEPSCGSPAFNEDTRMESEGAQRVGYGDSLLMQLSTNIDNLYKAGTRGLRSVPSRRGSSDAVATNVDDGVERGIEHVGEDSHNLEKQKGAAFAFAPFHSVRPGAFVLGGPAAALQALSARRPYTTSTTVRRLDKPPEDPARPRRTETLDLPTTPAVPKVGLQGSTRRQTVCVAVGTGDNAPASPTNLRHHSVTLSPLSTSESPLT